MHVRRLPSGKWRWIVQHRGQRLDGTELNRARAILAGSRALVDLGADHPASTSSTIEELLTAWQAEHEDEWSPTYRVDVAHVCANLPRAFLDRDIGTVEPAVIATLQRSLLRAGWSPHRIQRLRGCLSGAYTMAIDYGWTPTNPVRDVKAPKVEPSRVNAPTVDVVRAILNTAPPPIRLYLWLAANTGARRGELVGLQWGDLDDRDLWIHRAVVQVAGSRPEVRGVKTGRKGERRLELDDTSVALLEEHRTAQ